MLALGLGATPLACKSGEVEAKSSWIATSVDASSSFEAFFLTNSARDCACFINRAEVTGRLTGKGKDDLCPTHLDVE